MNETEVIEIVREAVTVMMKIVGPVLLTGLVVGIAVSLVQAVTQIQETTLTFIPKLLAVFGVMLFMLPFMMATLGGFTHMLTDRIVQIGLAN